MELCYLKQHYSEVNFPSWISGCDSDSSSFLDWFLSSVFVSGDFNVHHKGWLTCSGELCYLKKHYSEVNFPSWISGCNSDSSSFLDLFLSSDTSICSTMAVNPLENFNHVVSVSIYFPVNSKLDTLLHCKAYDYSFAN